MFSLSLTLPLSPSLSRTHTRAQRSFVSVEASIWSEVAAFLASVGAGPIALNIDTNFAFSDGLAAGELEAMGAGLGTAIMERVVRRPNLGMDFIALRAPTMLPLVISSRLVRAGVDGADAFNSPSLVQILLMYAPDDTLPRIVLVRSVTALHPQVLSTTDAARARNHRKSVLFGSHYRGRDLVRRRAVVDA